MLKPILLATALLAPTVAAPGLARAQANTHTGSTSAATPGVSGNLNNPQAQANQAGQPANAKTMTNGDAASIPTPTTGDSGKIPQQPSPAAPGAIK